MEARLPPSLILASRPGESDRRSRVETVRELGKPLDVARMKLVAVGLADLDRFSVQPSRGRAVTPFLVDKGEVLKALGSLRRTFRKFQRFGFGFVEATGVDQLDDGIGARDQFLILPGRVARGGPRATKLAGVGKLRVDLRRHRLVAGRPGLRFQSLIAG